MTDPTEAIRRQQVESLNSAELCREVLLENYPQVWDTTELQTDFDVQGFAAPYVIVVRRSDKERGTLQFQHQPRLYFNFVTERETE